MQIGDLPIPDKASKIGDLCSHKLTALDCDNKKIDCTGKMSGLDGTRQSAQTWTAGGHSKNIWFIDSSDAPHSVQSVSPCIPLALNFFLTDIYPDTRYDRKCFILGG